jgi:hypothetical protein
MSLAVSLVAILSTQPCQARSDNPLGGVPLAGVPLSVPVFVDQCFNFAIEPKIVMLACADGGIAVTDIHWQQWWGSPQISGDGTYRRNDCQPDCASGHFHSEHALVTLRKIAFCDRIGRLAYTEIWVLRTSQANAVPELTRVHC